MSQSADMSTSGTQLNLPADDSIERILIIRWSAMGDVALSSAALDDVCRAFPGRQIDLNTLAPWSALFANDPRFTKVLDMPLRTPRRAIAEHAKPLPFGRS